MPVEAIVLGVLLFVVIVLLARLYMIVHRLDISFAKLGYVVREDAKKYFDEAADKIVDTNEQFQTTYKKIVQDGTTAALSDVGTTLEKTLAHAQKEAGDVIMNARQDAQNIIIAAQREADAQTAQALNQTVDTIRWVMEQYIGTHYTVEQHQEIITTLLETYINEHRN